MGVRLGMDGNTAQEGFNQVRPGGRRLVTFLVSVLIFAFGVLVGLGVTYFLLPSKLGFRPQALPPAISVGQVSETGVTEDMLPVGLEVLQNPVVYEWRGSVRGRLISKDESSFILEDDEGNRITISERTAFGERFRTSYYDTTEEVATPSGTLKEISLNDIPLGATLGGEVWIFSGGKNTPVGGSFFITEK